MENPTFHVLIELIELLEDFHLKNFDPSKKG